MKQLTMFEKCTILRDRIVTRAAECMNYTNWGNDFVVSQIKELSIIPKRWVDEQGSFEIQPCELTSKEMDVLGFGKWSEKSVDRLIPLWMFVYLPEDIKTKCIDGSECIKKSSMDNDHRFGCLAYGVTPKDNV